MPRLLLTSLLILVLALFSPLLFLPRTEAHGEEAPPPVVSDLPEPSPATGEADTELAFTVLGPEGTFRTTMADYLPGAVAAEMPALFETEALRAQAVAIRTYILRGCAVSNPNHPEADVCVSPDCCKAWLPENQLREKWGGDYDVYFQKVVAAAADTDGQYLSYEGQAIQAVFHASSAGRTEDSAGVWSDVPYLVSVPSPETDETVEKLTTTVSFYPDELRECVLAARPQAQTAGAPESWLGNLTPTESGRVAQIQLCGETFTGTEARKCLGLRSTDFDVIWDGTSFVFTVRGYGHGVGMSQQGAELLAKEGLDYTEILAHYYPGTELICP